MVPVNFISRRQCLKCLCSINATNATTALDKHPVCEGDRKWVRICGGLRCSMKLWLLRFYGRGKTRSLSQFQLFREF